MKKKIGIINLGLSNLGSIFNVIKYCGNQPVLISKYKQIKDFSHIILPGVGSFNEASQEIRNFHITRKEAQALVKNLMENFQTIILKIRWIFLK